ncbi:hypothetical protein CHU98_g5568 [Xylaria longipes]|nr:hypothetical protein CHU98_g5568 [Xylaria longipes]
MPKNKGKGGKNRRRGKNESDKEKRELVYVFLPPFSNNMMESQLTGPDHSFKEEGQEYAQVVKMLGSGRLSCSCFDGQTRLAHIRGKLRKKVWINNGDIILLSLRDYQDDKGDVLIKYTADEARSLKQYGELPESARINETDTYGPGDEGECNFDFADDQDSDEESDSGGNKEIEIDDI